MRLPSIPLRHAMASPHCRGRGRSWRRGFSTHTSPSPSPNPPSGDASGHSPAPGAAGATGDRSYPRNPQQRPGGCGPSFRAFSPRTQQRGHYGQNFRPPSGRNGPYEPRAMPRLADYRRQWRLAHPQPPKNSEKFQVLSYNILADYIVKEQRAELYFHIPEFIVNWEWRKNKLLFELQLWSPDIMCLQEVDRFHDLEAELQSRGYSGIWKMRTGKAVDGCAIFWQTKRFSLQYEEHIEFNQLDLRDNVAQICVFESNIQGGVEKELSSFCTSSERPVQNQVVICNIHVLYNPRRGDIKLGQIRTLLDRAYAVSRQWNNAPVIVCGDFNSTPKSPLYSFINDQKLDFSKLSRYHISGQCSVKNLQKPYVGSNHYRSSPSPGAANHVEEGMLASIDTSLEQSFNAASLGYNKTSTGCYLNVNKEHIMPEKNDEDDTEYAGVIVSLEGSKEAYVERDHRYEIDRERVVDMLSSKASSLNISEGTRLDLKELTYMGPSRVQELGTEDSVVSAELDTVCAQNVNFDSDRSGVEFGKSDVKVVDGQPLDFSLLSEENIVMPSMENALEVCVEETVKLPNIHCQSETSGMEQTSHGNVFTESSERLNSSWTAGSSFQAEHPNTSTASYDNSDPSFYKELMGTEYENALVRDLTLHAPLVKSNTYDGKQNYCSSGGAVSYDYYAFDPYLWKPEEIKSASGDEKCMCIEHSLKLRSVYTDVEDTIGTRDVHGEPLVTSYHTRFMGTVDYIWCSDGLRTVKVLDTIPKQVLEQTTGFPTKKWGSDHIALACELAFADCSSAN